MKKTFLAATLVLLLSACSSGGGEVPADGTASSAPAARSSPARAASAVKDAVAADAMPWMEYADPVLGIAFKHPAYAGDMTQPGCTSKMVPLTVIQNGDHLTLLQEYALTPGCAAAKPTNLDRIAQGATDAEIAGSYLNVWVRNVGYPDQFLEFARGIYGTDCRIDDTRVFEWKSPSWKQIYLTTDSQDVSVAKSCNDSFLLYDDTTGNAVTFFLPLKTAVTFATPDQQSAFDFDIQESFRFLGQ